MVSLAQSSINHDKNISDYRSKVKSLDFRSVEQMQIGNMIGWDHEDKPKLTITQTWDNFASNPFSLYIISAIYWIKLNWLRRVWFYRKVYIKIGV